MPHTTPPDVTVIVVAYNSGDLLIDCIQAVLASSCSVEIIVADNASTDLAIDTVIELSQYEPRLSVIRNSSNLGFGAAVNRVAALATTPYILVLNPDCLVNHDSIAKSLAAASCEADIGVVGCRMTFPDGSTDPNSCRRLPTPSVLVKTWLGIAGNDELRCNSTDTGDVEAISGAFMLMPKDFFLALNGFDERYFLHWEDLDLCARIRNAGFKVRYLPENPVIHCKGSSSTSRNRWVEWQKHLGLLKFIHKFHFAHVPLPVLAVLALPLWLRLLVRIARPIDSRQRDL